MLAAVDHLGAEPREALGERRDVAAGEPTFDDAREDVGDGTGEIRRTLGIEHRPFVRGHQRRGRDDFGGSGKLVEHLVRAAGALGDGACAVAVRVAVETVPGRGGPPDGLQLRLPELGDRVLAPCGRAGGQRDVEEEEQLGEVDTAAEGERADSVAVQAEAKAPLARHLAVDHFAFEQQRARLDGEGQVRNGREQAVERRKGGREIRRV